MTQTVGRRMTSTTVDGDLMTWHRLSDVGADINDGEQRLDDMANTVAQEATSTVAVPQQTSHSARECCTSTS